MIDVAGPGMFPVMGNSETMRLKAVVHGHVQGVGFRWFVQSQARPRGLLGYAHNLLDGTVEVVAEGTRENLGQLLGAIRGGAGPGQVTKVETELTDPEGEFKGFTIG